MNTPTLIFALLSSCFLFALPRRLAALPLLVGSSYLTMGPAIDLGPLSFYVIRILIVVGIVRTLVKGEHISGEWNALDKMMALWAIWAICSSFFHADAKDSFVGRLGIAFDGLGLYILFRVFINDTDSLWTLSRLVILMLIPIACEMVIESKTGRNAFSIFGGVSPYCELRGGSYRAQGPFGGSIPAGTVGAVCLPLALLFWRPNRKFAIIGLMATGAIILSSHSSGPIMTAVFALFGVFLWRVRDSMRTIRWGAVAGIILLDLVMKAPVYYLIARIDLTGSSTGFHRAALIESAINHLNEWWLTGTDYTRHWMPTGISWNQNHTDITNHYIKMGVWGGMPLMLLFVGALSTAFSFVGKALRVNEDSPFEHRFLLWTLGAILFSHAATFVSVSYYDQSVVFLYMILACIGSVPSFASIPSVVTSDEVVDPIPSYESNLYQPD